MLLLGIVLEHMAPGMTIATPSMTARRRTRSNGLGPEVEDREPEAASAVAGSAERDLNDDIVCKFFRQRGGLSFLRVILFAPS